MPGSLAIKPLLRVLAGERESVPPIWLMRQAGRYLPEYRAIREKAAGFLDLCFDPKRAAEITLQPIRRFGFDAAILFSDILVVPHALGQRVTFEDGEGPRLDALKDPGALNNLYREIDHIRLEPVYETITRVKQNLPPAVAFLGFCGAPWTLATYMIAGAGTTDQLPARLFAYRFPDVFAELIDMLVEASASYLTRQFAAGVDAAQIFDTWAGVLPADDDIIGAVLVATSLPFVKILISWVAPSDHVFVKTMTVRFTSITPILVVEPRVRVITPLDEIDTVPFSVPDVPLLAVQTNVHVPFWLIVIVSFSYHGAPGPEARPLPSHVPATLSIE